MPICKNVFVFSENQKSVGGSVIDNRKCNDPNQWRRNPQVSRQKVQKNVMFNRENT
jgi:hypothetical protein